jgi:hypothetical protein
MLACFGLASGWRLKTKGDVRRTACLGVKQQSSETSRYAAWSPRKNKAARSASATFHRPSSWRSLVPKEHRARCGSNASMPSNMPATTSKFASAIRPRSCCFFNQAADVAAVRRNSFFLKKVSAISGNRSPSAMIMCLDIVVVISAQLDRRTQTAPGDPLPSPRTGQPCSERACRASCSTRRPVAPHSATCSRKAASRELGPRRIEDDGVGLLVRPRLRPSAPLPRLAGALCLDLRICRHCSGRV